MKFLICFLVGIFVFKASAQMAVHDESTRQQLYLNAKAQIAATENSRKWLDIIIKNTGNTYDKGIQYSNQQVFFCKSWRKAVETLLQINVYITIKRNGKVLPV